MISIVLRIRKILYFSFRPLWTVPSAPLLIVWLVSWFNDILTFVRYVMLKPVEQLLYEELHVFLKGFSPKIKAVARLEFQFTTLPTTSREPLTIFGIIVILRMFNSFSSSLARSKYLPIFSLGLLERQNQLDDKFFVSCQLIQNILIGIGWSIFFSFTNPSARSGYDTRSIFKRSLRGLNSEFSFS